MNPSYLIKAMKLIVQYSNLLTIMILFCFNFAFGKNSNGKHVEKIPSYVKKCAAIVKWTGLSYKDSRSFDISFNDGEFYIWKEVDPANKNPNNSSENKTSFPYKIIITKKNGEIFKCPSDKNNGTRKSWGNSFTCKLTSDNNIKYLSIASREQGATAGSDSDADGSANFRLIYDENGKINPCVELTDTLTLKNKNIKNCTAINVPQIFPGSENSEGSEKDCKQAQTIDLTKKEVEQKDENKNDHGQKVK